MEASQKQFKAIRQQLVTDKESPLVSVIIPCYNHGHFLPRAIESVANQTYSNHETIVVDDGSVDNTREVVSCYQNVLYVHQANSGLSAARNTGIINSKGDYFIFLDADDWLLPEAIQTNLSHFLSDNTLGLVAGSYINHYEQTGEEKHERNVEGATTYVDFLQRNYVRMHAAVMFPRRVFEKLRYDTTLRACEDWDVYLKIAREYKVFNHVSPIAVYRRYGTSMSGNGLNMLESGLNVLDRQRSFIRTNEELRQLYRGKLRIKELYTKKIFQSVVASLQVSDVDSKKLLALRKHNKKLFIKAMQKIVRKKLVLIKQKAVSMAERSLFKTGLTKKFMPRVGAVNFGDFGRTKPFNTNYGYSRGGPVDRYYIENFLKENARYILGRVLEIGDNVYTVQFGETKVSRSDILHIDDTNEQATFVGDLSNAPELPDEAFDCIILTQTLQFIYDVKAAVATCHRILKPGGTLLLTVPGITNLGKDEWNFLWMFTTTSVRRLLSEHFESDEINVETHGNVFSATAFLYGMGAAELKKAQLDVIDPGYQLIITAKARKK
jgi:glycosyltransferase involved in cell wall biosynthesis